MQTALEKTQNFHQKIVDQYLGGGDQPLADIHTIAANFALSVGVVEKILKASGVYRTYEARDFDGYTAQASGLRSSLRDYMVRKSLTAGGVACLAGGTLNADRISGILDDTYVPSADEITRLQKVITYKPKAGLD